MLISKSIHKEGHLRSLIKAISWRIFSSLATIVISLAVTHSMQFAISIGMIEVFVKIILFYFHERLWLLSIVINKQKNHDERGF